MITWFDVIIYALGWVFVTKMAWAVGKFIPRVAIAFARACSVCLWVFRIIKTHGLKGNGGLSWLSLFFWTFIGGLNERREQMSHEHGVWDGVGSWTVFPPKESA